MADVYTIGDYSHSSQFNKDANFKKVKFGDKSPVLEVELEELQDILGQRLRDFISQQIGDGIYDLTKMTYSSGTLTIADNYIVVGGQLLYISNLSLALAKGESAYLDVYETTVDYTSTLKKYGNDQETNTVTNSLYDSRVPVETARRIALRYTLSKTNGVAGHTYLLLGAVDSSTGTTFNVTVKSLQNNQTIQKGIADSLTNAKAYADQQIQMVTSTGIPKLVSYVYDLTASSDNQTVFTIPYQYFDKTTDTLTVSRNGISVPESYFSVTNPVTNGDSSITNGYITLTTGVSNGTLIKLRIFKNVPIGSTGSINGGVLAQNSIPQDRIIGISDITSGIALLNASNLATDLNACGVAGQTTIHRVSSGTLNTPYAGGLTSYSLGIAETKLSSSTWGIQMLYVGGGTNPLVFGRALNSGTWGNWTRTSLLDDTGALTLKTDLRFDTGTEHTIKALGTNVNWGMYFNASGFGAYDWQNSKSVILYTPSTSVLQLCSNGQAVKTYANVLDAGNGDMKANGVFTTNVALEVGPVSGSSTPYIDFHSSGNNIDYDSRIIASGGSSTIGQGNIEFQLGGYFRVNGANIVRALSGGYKIQSGTGSFAYGTANSQISTSITFPVAYSSAPLILCGYGGGLSASPSINVFSDNSSNVTATGAQINAVAAVTGTVRFWWVAIGS